MEHWTTAKLEWGLAFFMVLFYLTLGPHRAAIFFLQISYHITDASSCGPELTGKGGLKINWSVKMP